MNETAAFLTIINRLLASFPSTHSGQGDDAVDGYLIGLSGIPPEYVAKAAQRFLAGQVTGQSMSFAPSPAQLASEARTYWHKDLDSTRLSLPPPVEPEIPASERQRVAAGFKRLAVDIGSKLNGQREEDDLRRKLDWEKVNHRFRPDMTPEALSQRLGIGTGFITGNDDGEGI